MHVNTSIVTINCIQSSSSLIDEGDCPYYSYANFGVKLTDYSKIVEVIPESIFSDTSIHTEIYCSEETTISPCEKKMVKTGIEIKCFLPFSHHIRFEGIRTSLGVVSHSKYVNTLNKELLINVQNFSTCDKKIPKGMNLGKLIIASND